VRVDRYCDKSDSLHIYGKDLEGVGGFSGFLSQLSRPFSELTWNSGDKREYFVEARHLLAAQLAAEKEGLGKGVVKPGVDVANFPYPAEWDL